MAAARNTQPKINSLPVIDTDDTILDLPETDDPPAADLPPVMPSPEPHTIVIEEDIIGSKAAITYKESIKELCDMVTLPVTYDTSYILKCLEIIQHFL